MSDELAWFAQQLPGCAVVYDRRGRCLLANAALQQWLQRTEADLLDRSMFELWPADVAAREAADLDLVLEGARLAHQEKRPGPLDERFVRVVKFPWQSAGLVEGMAVVFEPTGDSSGAETPSEVVGRLALGIIHDFNSSLAQLRNQLLELEEVLDDRQAAGNALDKLRKVRHSISQFAMTTADFVHEEPPGSSARRERLDVNALLSSLEQVLESSHPGIALEYQLQQGGAWVEGDPLQLTQALLNLANNALAAIPDRSARRLNLETRVVRLSDASGRHRGEIVRVTIHDSGPGTSVEVLPRHFEPLLGARIEERGGTLGLALVQEVVHRHGGWVACQRNADPGTRFILHLPAAVWSPWGEVLPSRHGVLIVEPDPDIRHLTALILEQGPFRTWSAGSLEQARRSLLAANEPVSLVVVAADLCGRRSHLLLLELLRQAPEAGLLVTMSGEPPVLPESCRQALRGYLPKPYSADFLLRAAESALGRRPH